MEQPLKKDACCCLGSINLNELVSNPYSTSAEFNFAEFRKLVRIGVKALDDIIDENADNHPLQEQKENSLNYRNIGLGVMGYANALMKLGLVYGSQKALDFSDKLFDMMFRNAVCESSKLAIIKGTFPKFKDILFDSTIIRNHFMQDEIADLRKFGLRNCSLLSIAPTGSIGTMLGISGGIEPEFALSYQRKTESLNDGKDKTYTVYCNSVAEYYKITNNPLGYALPKYFISSNEIPWKDRVKTQAIIQRNIDTAISSTVNLPNSTTMQDVEALYLYAWQNAIKGITIYRSGCKREGILTTETSKPESKLEEQKCSFEDDVIPWGTTIQLSDDLIGKKRKIVTGCGSMHVLAWFDPTKGNLLEVYLSKGSSGGCNAWMTSNSRMISLALRSGADFEYVIDQLKSIPSCPSYAVRSATKKDCSQGNNCSSAVANALVEMHKELKDEMFEDETEELVIPKITPKVIVTESPNNKSNGCPECGEFLVHESGCVSCKSCGFSKC